MPRLAIVFIVVASCAGPLDHPGSGGGGGTSSSSEQDEITTSNKLSLNKLSLNKLSLNALSTGALDGGAEVLAATDDGRELLKYVARCALPEGSEVVAGGQRYPGLLGLAPEWQDGACAEECQRWVSACLLAHVNALGVEVPISIRGVHTSIAVVPEAEARDYPIEEAGFYGDVFASDGGEMEMYACLGRGLADHEDSAYLDQRLCASSDACGFTHTGICAPLGEVWLTGGLDAERSACWEDAGELGYTGCTTAEGVNWDSTDWGGGGAAGAGLPGGLWFEVVTVYLKRS